MSESPKKNVFLSEEDDAPATTIKAKRKPRVLAVKETEVEQFARRIREGELSDTETLLLAEALSVRKAEMKARLLEQVKAVYGEEYVVTKPGETAGSAIRSNRPGRHPNEIDLSPAAQGDQAPSVYGIPTIHDNGEAIGGVTATDPMAVAGNEGGEITTTGAVIG